MRRQRIALLLLSSALLPASVGTCVTTLVVAGGATFMTGCSSDRSDTRQEARTEARTSARAEERVDERRD